MSRSATQRASARAGWRRLVTALAALGCGLGGGCAAITNPVADGVPARRLPEEVFVRIEPQLITGRELVGGRSLYGVHLQP